MPGIPSDVFVQQSQPALLILGVHEDMSPADRLGLVEQMLLLDATDFWKREKGSAPSFGVT